MIDKSIPFRTFSDETPPLRVRFRESPIDKVRLDSLPAAELVDRRLESDVERSIRGSEFLGPFGMAKADGTHGRAVLHEF